MKIPLDRPATSILRRPAARGRARNRPAARGGALRCPPARNALARPGRRPRGAGDLAPVRPPPRRRAGAARRDAGGADGGRRRRARDAPHGSRGTPPGRDPGRAARQGGRARPRALRRPGAAPLIGARPALPRRRPTPSKSKRVVQPGRVAAAEPTPELVALRVGLSAVALAFVAFLQLAETSPAHDPATPAPPPRPRPALRPLLPPRRPPRRRSRRWRRRPSPPWPRQTRRGWARAPCRAQGPARQVDARTAAGPAGHRPPPPRSPSCPKTCRIRTARPVATPVVRVHAQGNVSLGLRPDRALKDPRRDARVVRPVHERRFVLVRGPASATRLAWAPTSAAARKLPWPFGRGPRAPRPARGDPGGGRSRRRKTGAGRRSWWARAKAARASSTQRVERGQHGAPHPLHSFLARAGRFPRARPGRRCRASAQPPGDPRRRTASRPGSP